MGSYQHPTATCTFEHKDVKRLLYQDNNNNNDDDEADSQYIFVELYFRNWIESHYKTNCPCKHNSIPITRNLPIDNAPFVTTLRFPFNPKTLHLSVLVAASEQGLPDYVTPGVWTSVKEEIWSTIEEHDDVVDYYNINYCIFLVVDVSTINVIDDGNGDSSLLKNTINDNINMGSGSCQGDSKFKGILNCDEDDDPMLRLLPKCLVDELYGNCDEDDDLMLPLLPKCLVDELYGNCDDEDDNLMLRLLPKCLVDELYPNCSDDEDDDLMLRLLPKCLVDELYPNCSDDEDDDLMLRLLPKCLVDELFDDDYNGE